MWYNTRLLTSKSVYLRSYAVFRNDLRCLTYYYNSHNLPTNYYNRHNLQLKYPSHDSCYNNRYTNCTITRRNSSNSEKKSQKFLLDNRNSNNLNENLITNNKSKSDNSEIQDGCAINSLNKKDPERNVTGSIQHFQNTIDPYFKLMRLDKPIGSWLLFWPCSWSITLASDPSILSVGEVAQIMGLFLAGAVIMRGAGCTINDMWDKDIDAKVERTRSRPLVSGEITRKKALVFLAGQLSLGLTILLQLNWYSVALGASSMVLVILYPLAKRVTDYPQFVLGLAFNWGALLGWSAVTGHVDSAVCLPLYAAGVCWTLLYDTIYAHQDKRDDAIIGVRSTALKFGSYTKPCLAVFSGGMVSCLTAVGVAADLGLPYFMTLGLVGAHTAKQIITLDTENPRDCADKFVSNSTIGMLIFFGILAGKWKTIKEYINDVQKVDANQPLTRTALVH